MYQIEWLGMTRNHFRPGTPDRIRMIVLHATAGTYPGDLKWLRQGGAPGREVSVHYYINKRGQIFQLVADQDIAWHAGASRWEVDGKPVSGCNSVSLGIELENRNDGRDPYPDEQYAATLWLTRLLAQKYQIPASQVVRHLDISPGRKTDPAGFPWQRFLSEVFADLPGAPTLPVGERLRLAMLDAAYRAAGSGLPADWPFFARARAAGLGMPVASLITRPAAPREGAAPADRERALRLPDGSRYLVEVYARDALFAATSDPDDTLVAADRIGQLSATPASPLRMALLDAIFAAADPVNGFQPGWAFHQYFLANMAALGMPISHNHRLALTPAARFACQHFALDSLCSPVGQWQIIYRLSDMRQVAAGQRTLPGLSRERAAALVQLLLDDLFALRTGRRYQPDAALTQFALTEQLGAPLGPAEMVVIDDQPVAIMPFALDVVACRLPTPDWPLDRPLPPAHPIGRLTALLGYQRHTQGIVRLSQPGELRLPPLLAGSIAVLGPPRPGCPLIDVSLFAGDGELRRRPIDTIVLVSVREPASSALAQAHASARWHYFIDHTGTVFRLRHERYVARAARGIGAAAERLDQRAIVIAVEGHLADAATPLRASTRALVQLLRRHFQIAARRVVVIDQSRLAELTGLPDV